MSRTATFLRWLATFVAFPIGSLLAVSIIGSVTGPLTAAVGGLIVGLVLGLAQWLALRPSGMSPWWIAATAGSLALGMGVTATVTGAATTVGALALTGAISGAMVGLAQGLLRGSTTHAWVAGLIWAALMSTTWAVGWVITSQVIVDADRGYVTFGSSGAIVATVVTGLLVHRLIVAPADPRPAHPVGTDAAVAR